MKLVCFLCSETLQVPQVLLRAPRTARPRREPDYFSVTHLHRFSVTYAHISEVPDLTVRRESQMSPKPRAEKKKNKKQTQTFLVPLFHGQERLTGAPEQDLTQRTSWPMTGDLHLITSCNSSLVTIMFLLDAYYALSSLLLRNVQALQKAPNAVCGGNWPLLLVCVLRQRSPSKSCSHWCVERSHPFHFTPHPRTGGRIKQDS